VNSFLLRRVFRLLLVLACLALLVVSARFVRTGINHEQESIYSRNLRLLQALDAELDEQILATRGNLSAHYDPLVERVTSIRRLQTSLADVPAFLGRAAVTELRAKLAEYNAQFAVKERDVESFKTTNAVLKNSLHFFPTAAGVFINNPKGPQPQSSQAVRTTIGALLTLEIMPTRDALAAFVRSVQELTSARAFARTSAEAESIEVLVLHARAIAIHKPLVDNLVRRIVTSPAAESSARLNATYTTRYLAKLDSVQTQQGVIFALAIVIITLGFIEIILKLQLHSTAMARASSELSAVNAALAKERERERELNELKSRFVSMTSHEFRTPLAGIISSSELLEKYAARWETGRIRTHLERIKTAAQNMSRMLEEMLVIGRADAGMLQPSPAPINLDECCRQLLHAIGRNHGQHKMVSYRFEGDPMVMMDERLLTHVVSNLVENAFKYSPDQGSVTLTVDRRDASCRIEVQDDGIGIPASDLSGIFEGFHRASNVGRIPGTGLGLAVVKRAIEVQAGSISVSSHVGRGTTFTVQLPAPLPESPTTEVKAS
jgi:signal transduction histidine kinase